MEGLPKEIDEHYRRGGERERLSNKTGTLEQVRTQAILARHLPPAPAVILDIGGASGAYAIPLAEQGYQVHLVDPVELHLEQAREYAARSGVALASAKRGDARHLDFASNSAGAVLLLGPLYHLIDRADRLQALVEARRALKPGGVLFAASISRFASLIDGLAQGFFEDAQFREIVGNDLTDGVHRNPTNRPEYFTTAYFHRPEDLAGEVREAGFTEMKIVAIEGPVWATAQFPEAWNNAKQREKLLEFLSLIEGEPSLAGASAHLVAIAPRSD